MNVYLFNFGNIVYLLFLPFPGEIKFLLLY